MCSRPAHAAVRGRDGERESAEETRESEAERMLRSRLERQGTLENRVLGIVYLFFILLRGDLLSVLI